MNVKSKESFLDIEKPYEFFDVTADVGFWAYGNTLEDAYQNASLAMFDVMTDTKKVSQSVSKEIKIEIAKIADSIVIREEADIYKIADAIAEKLEGMAPNLT